MLSMLSLCIVASVCRKHHPFYERRSRQTKGMANSDISTNPQIWLSALVTLACMKLLYKENPAYRIAENAFVGFAGAHALVVGFENIKRSLCRFDTRELPSVSSGALGFSCTLASFEIPPMEHTSVSPIVWCGNRRGCSGSG